MFDDIQQIEIKQDHLNIKSVTINRNQIHLVVEYGGGCETHEFKLYGFSGLARGIFPTEAKLYLSHNANGDLCKVLIREELVFDLTPLGILAVQQGYHGNTVILKVHAPGETTPCAPEPAYQITDGCIPC